MPAPTAGGQAGSVALPEPAHPTQHNTAASAPTGFERRPVTDEATDTLDQSALPRLGGPCGRRRPWQLRQAGR